MRGPLARVSAVKRVNIDGALYLPHVSGMAIGQRVYTRVRVGVCIIYVHFFRPKPFEQSYAIDISEGDWARVSRTGLCSNRTQLATVRVFFRVSGMSICQRVYTRVRVGVCKLHVRLF